MSEETKALLRRLGPALTTKHIAELIKTGVSETTARKRVQRGTAHYHKLAGIRALRKTPASSIAPRIEDYGDVKFWTNLEEAFYTHGKSYWAVLVNLRARGGACPKERFAQISGAPTARRRQLSPDAILERLKAINLLEETVEGDQTYIKLRPFHLRTTPIEVIRANELAEFVALHGIKEWARRLGFGSYNQFNMRGEDEAPVVSGITFDLSAPSYFRPLLQIACFTTQALHLAGIGFARCIPC